MNSPTTLAAMGPITRPRQVERLVQGQATSDGAGVRLTRLLSGDMQRRLDPYLMLDAFGTDRPDDYIAGFPDHPHRGFETVTYMLQGRMRHRDSMGHDSVLGPGGVQWMTAGRGVVHSEMPEQQDGAMEGFQLWLNLPARRKLCPPAYRDIPTEALPEWQGPGLTVRVIAGESNGLRGAEQRADTEPLILDVDLQADTEWAQNVPAGHNAFAVVYRGELDLAGTTVAARQLAVLTNGEETDGVRLRAGPDGARLLLVAGRPLREPIAQHGPFVMNTRAELMQAVQDFNAGRLA